MGSRGRSLYLRSVHDPWWGGISDAVNECLLPADPLLSEGQRPPGEGAQSGSHSSLGLLTSEEDIRDSPLLSVHQWSEDGEC